MYRQLKAVVDEDLGVKFDAVMLAIQPLKNSTPERVIVKAIESFTKLFGNDLAFPSM